MDVRPIADSRLPRREFLRAVVRTGLLGLLVGGTGALALRPRCGGAAACEGCPTLGTCNRPQAATAQGASGRSDPADRAKQAERRAAHGR